MLLTQTVRLKPNSSEKDILANLCHLSKNLFNVGLYTVRQYTREHGSVYVTVPPNIRGNRIKETRILPKQKGKFLDAAFVYESENEQINVNRDEAISIDLGLNNLATVVSTTNDIFQSNYL
jgi:transposase